MAQTTAILSYSTLASETLREGKTTVISGETSNLSDMTVEDAEAAILRDRPELAEYMEQVDTTELSSGADLVNALNNLLTDSGSSMETVTVNDDEYTGTLFFDDLKDLAFEVATTAEIIIEIAGVQVLDNIYEPGFDGMVHLDLQELVRTYSGIFLPTAISGDESVIDGICHEYMASPSMKVTVKEGTSTKYYELEIRAFESGADTKMTDIDEMRIPSDYLMPISIYLPYGAQDKIITAHFESAARNEQLNGGVIAQEDEEGNAYKDAVLYAQDIPAGAIPFKEDEPFRICLKVPRIVAIKREGHPVRWSTVYQDVYTPVFTVCGEKFEQYIFLNKYGHYDNVAMSGELTYAPEYEFDNANRSYVIEQVKGIRSELWTQNTGALSRATMKALSELLLSPMIYRYVPGESLRRIVIENPSLGISSRKNVNSGSFSWRYVNKTI